MSVRQILSLKRASLQTRMDALIAKEAGLLAQLRRLSQLGDGLDKVEDGGAFQIAARFLDTARTQSARLESQRRELAEARINLAKEKLALDIADKKLGAEEQKAERLAASRAADRV